ncbi:MAG: hydrogenase nickel incorporation protein HypB [Thermodesulfovibrionales bacterium]
MKLKVVKNILEANERLALSNRQRFEEAGVFVINLMSAPGAGKTSLLEKTLTKLNSRLKIGVIEGDITGTEDAERLARFGIPVVQINTQGACHLDANMIGEVLDEIPLKELDILFIENVGNLVCPAEFSVGEDRKVMLLSITEGDDKPSKYPLMFRESSVLLINKIDLLPYLDVKIERIKMDSLMINPSLRIFEVSCRTEQGLDQWTAWLLSEAERKNKK